jgi:hypothetical protein
MSRQIRVVVFLVAAVSVGLAQLLAAQVVATGLVNPRGIAQAPNGWIYVAEAGNGGTGCAAPPAPCFGLTGALTQIDPTGVDSPVRIISGLPSLTRRTPAESTGPNHLSFQGTGGLYLTMGLGGDVPLRESLGPQAAILGKVLKVAASGEWKVVADVTAHEQRWNPDLGIVDSNPYGIAALASRRIVADAGANALIEALPSGTTRTLAVFPTRMVPPPGPPGAPLVPMQPVPTSVAEGPDGYLYVGELTGFPFQAGAARVYRVPPEGGAPEVCATGFTTITDIAFDPEGRLYVLQFSSGLGFPANTGKLSRVDTCGSAPVDLQVGLSHPTGLVIGVDGAVYVTNKTLAPTGTGEVLRIPLD